MKEKIARFGVEYASNKLGLSEIKVTFKTEDYFINKDVNATFISEIFFIVFNSTWLEEANEIEILKCSFHETRHAYQKAAIEFPHLIYHDPMNVEIWKKEFANYKQPGQNTYLNQAIEIDAIEFSNILINDLIKEIN